MADCRYDRSQRAVGELWRGRRFLNSPALVPTSMQPPAPPIVVRGTVVRYASRSYRHSSFQSSNEVPVPSKSQMLDITWFHQNLMPGVSSCTPAVGAVTTQLQLASQTLASRQLIGSSISVDLVAMGWPYRIAAWRVGRSEQRPRPGL